MLDLFAWGIVIYIGYVLFSIFRNTVKTESAKYKRKRSNQDKIEKFKDEEYTLEKQIKNEENTAKQPIDETQSQPDIPAQTAQELLQKELDRYLAKNRLNTERGLEYERYIGYLFEQKGYKVEYRGALSGLSDSGIDLVLSMPSYQDKTIEVVLVQAKCWRRSSIIRSNVIAQLHGSREYFMHKECNGLEEVRAVLVTTTRVDSEAKEMAEALEIEIITERMDEDYPRVKIYQAEDNSVLYILPFDAGYDESVAVGYVGSVVEAEQLGCKRK